MEIKDKLLFDSNYDELSLICYICESSNHLSSECSRVHFDKKNPYVVLRHISTCPQERSTPAKSRKDFKFPNSLENICNVMYATQLLR